MYGKKKRIGIAAAVVAAAVAVASARWQEKGRKWVLGNYGVFAIRILARARTSLQSYEPPLSKLTFKSNSRREFDSIHIQGLQSLRSHAG